MEGRVKEKTPKDLILKDDLWGSIACVGFCAGFYVGMVGNFD